MLPLSKDSDSSLAARVEGKSSYARCGLLAHFTAPTIHAGFEGRVDVIAGPRREMLLRKSDQWSIGRRSPKLTLVPLKDSSSDRCGDGLAAIGWNLDTCLSLFAHG